MRPGPVKKSSTGTDRSPAGPTIRAVAPSAIRAGAISAEGEPLQMLPTTVARLRIATVAMYAAAWWSIGYFFRTGVDRLSDSMVARAPMRRPSPSAYPR